MVDQPLKDKDWTDVAVTLVYSDGRKTGAQRVQLNILEVQETEKQMARDRVDREIPADHPAREESLAEIEAWTMTQEEFKQRVLTQANRLVSSPIMVPGEEPHVLRILPLTAHQGVVIEVVNQESRVIRPS